MSRSRVTDTVLIDTITHPGASRRWAVRLTKHEPRLLQSVADLFADPRISYSWEVRERAKDAYDLAVADADITSDPVASGEVWHENESDRSARTEDELERRARLIVWGVARLHAALDDDQHNRLRELAALDHDAAQGGF